MTLNDKLNWLMGINEEDEQDLKEFIQYDPSDTKGIAERTYELWQYMKLQPEERK